MKLQTTLNLTKQSQGQINYNSQLLLLGSCFAEHMGAELEYFKFKTEINPFGILFHPLAVEKLILRAINKDYYNADELQYFNEQWFCFDAHSKLNANSSDLMLSSINTQLDKTHQSLKIATHICLTLGTSWVYRHIEKDMVVANCHKLPQKSFLKELMSIDDIEESLDAIVKLIRSVNQSAEIIFTVSPVRHLKDGLIENNRSKAHLISALHSVIDTRQKVHYFPAYELMIDELRDYRFYNQDMLHPNQTAITYIWQKFSGVWISEGVSKEMEMVDQIQKSIQHKPFNEASDSHKKFLENLEKKMGEIRSKINHISF